MLAEIGSVASIIGLSMSLVDQISSSFRKNEYGQTLAYFRALSGTSSVWKEIHHKYHSLGTDIRQISTELFIRDGRNQRMRSASEIAPDAMRNMFMVGTLGSEVRYFAGRLQPYMRILEQDDQRVSQEDREQTLNDLIASGNRELATQVGVIIASRADILSTHREFAKFLEWVAGCLDEPWDHTHVEEVLKHRALLHTDYWQVVNSADLALMAFLFLFNKVAEGIPTT